MSEYDIELRNAERAYQKAVTEFETSSEQVFQVEMATEVCSLLKNAPEEDTALLEFMKPGLEGVGINCESNISAAEGIETLLSVDTSNENFVFLILAIVGLNSLIDNAMKAIGMSRSYGTNLTAKVAKLKQIKIGDKFWNGKMNVTRGEWYSFEQFSDYLSAYTKAIKIITAAEGEFDKKLVDKVQAAMNSVGVKITDAGTVEHTDRYMPGEKTLKDLGWDPNNTKKSITIMDDLAKALVAQKGSAEKAKAMMKKAKVEASNKELTAEDKEKFKKKAEELKSSFKFIVKFISATIYKGWAFNIKWMVRDAEFIIQQYDVSKYKENKK